MGSDEGSDDGEQWGQRFVVWVLEVDDECGLDLAACGADPCLLHARVLKIDDKSDLDLAVRRIDVLA